jgi:VIT1/CCC1 family predicted Fe2+/Mn2+ transporter
MLRPSNHVEPLGPLATTRHYIRDLVYGASDGVITTFAVVSGVAGGSLSPAAVLILGTANLAADGLSMGVGNFLAIRANERARAADDLPEEEAYPVKHGLATFAAFVTAGSVPLLPYLVGAVATNAAVWSIGLTLSTMFGLGAARGSATEEAWWKAGLESLVLGSLVAAAAYGAGALAAALLGGATPGL